MTGRAPNVAAAAAAVPLGAVNGYLLALLIAAARERQSAPRGAADPGRLAFVVLIPACDEELSIADTIASLRQMDYPSDRMEVVVIADNCSDRTPATAAAAGATVWARSGGDRGKGAALAWAFERCRRERRGVDAVAVVDADCTVTPNLLSAIEARLRCGARAVQAAYTVANPGASWSSGLRYASFVLINRVRPLGKARLRLSAGLLGTGMAFRTELLLRQPWRAGSLIEDQEYHLDLVAAGERVEFVPEAGVTSPMPTSLAGATAQGMRWDAGRLTLMRKWLPVLLAAAVRRRDRAALHAAAETLVPPQSLLLAANLGAALLAVPAAPVLRRAGAANVAAQALFVTGGLALMRAPRSVWRSLAFTPALVAWKLSLLARLWLGRGPKRWERTARDPVEPAQPAGSRAGASRRSRRPIRPSWSART